MYIFEAVTFFSCLVLVQSTKFFMGITNLKGSCFWWSIFAFNYQNAYGHQTCQGGDIPPIYLHDISGVLWVHLTNKIHIPTCRRPASTKLDKVLTYCERLRPLKPHGPLIMREVLVLVEVLSSPTSCCTFP